MRKKIILVWLVVLLLGLAGCSMQPEEKEPEIVRSESLSFDDEFLHIGLIQTGKESGWRDANSNDYLETFTRERGYDLIYIDGNSSPKRQVKAMQDLIRQRVDYIIIQPIVEYDWDEAVELAQEAGIPVIVADRQISVDSDKYVAWAGSDFFEEGCKAIKWLEGYLEENDRQGEVVNIVLLEGTEGATATTGRTDGLMKQMEKHENWRIIASECANFTQGEAQTVMEQILTEVDPEEIDVVIAENDNMMFGAMKAMERKDVSFGPEGDIITISFDALQEAFEKMMDGKLHASIECNPHLAASVEEIIKKLERGETLKEKCYYIEEKVYDYKNASRYIKDRNY